MPKQRMHGLAGAARMCSNSLCRECGKTVRHQKLRELAPLMYRTLVDLVGIMEETSRDCNKCGPELWNYTQEVRRSLLDELAKAQLDFKD